MGVKNKYCTSCARAETQGIQPKPHTCYKNWGKGQSSSSMEPAIIADGFACSQEMYGLKYARLIADGDSSVYNRIRMTRPYKNTTVEKIECKNHLLRNFSNKLKQIATTGNRVKNTIYLRKKIGDNILRCRTAVTKAVQFRKTEKTLNPEKVDQLRLDILNIPSHVFGEHRKCVERGYFCQEMHVVEPSKSNIVPDLVEAGLYQQVSEVVKDISRHSRSLITDVTSNTVEHYNSLVAKYVGGKRINLALRGSYEGRCSAAVVQHNTGNVHYYLHKNLYKCSPGYFTKSTGVKRKRKVQLQRGKKKCKKTLFNTTTQDQDYGPAAQRPDIEEDVMRKEMTEFLNNLKKTPEEIRNIERATIYQSDCGEWLETRRNLLTASNFGRICKLKPWTGCESTIKQMLYTAFDCQAMVWGRNNEEVARQELANTIGKIIEPCGLFIDENQFFLGATPDGLIGDDGIAEIKCPSSAKNMTPEEAILARKVTFWTKEKNGTIGPINTTHNFFYQVQGQLHVTKRRYCQFTLWTPKGLKVERIERDDEFWNVNMKDKLERFYMDCLLPELVDPRHIRSMSIRNPTYIMEEQKKKIERAEEQKKKQMNRMEAQKNKDNILVSNEG